MIGLSHYLIVAAALFCIGVYGVLAKKNAIAVMMGIEFMLNAVNINLVAFNHFMAPTQLVGQVFAIFIIGVAAAEVSLGLAIILSLYRQRHTVAVDELDILKW
jgi:NADH:ubiquinone oxidoreductase subunit K